jgi:hypothetical protein
MARKRLVPIAVGPKKAFKYFCLTLSGFFLLSPKLYTVPEIMQNCLFSGQFHQHFTRGFFEHIPAFFEPQNKTADKKNFILKLFEKYLLKNFLQ